MTNLFSSYRFKSWLIYFIILFSIYLGSCHQDNKDRDLQDSLKKSWDATIPGNFSKQVAQVFDSTEIANFFSKYPNVKEYEADVRKFYKRRDYAYAWFDQDRLIEQAGNLFGRIKNLDKEGIYIEPEYQKTLDSLMYGSTGKKETRQLDVMLELMLTTEYFVFSHLAWEGMDTSVRRANDWFLPKKAVNYDRFLDSLLNMPAKQNLPPEPVYRQYELLRAFLRTYRKLDSTNTWEEIEISGSLGPGDSTAGISIIKQRLLKLGDFVGDGLGDRYNEELVSAVRRFQYRHGLLMDGIIGKGTLAALNVPPRKRIKQILVNMERSRWLPVGLSTDYLAVNIPEYKLHVYHADTLLWNCNVVVGKTDHPTTLFYGEIKYVVFSPYWNVPPGILHHEILPGMRKNSNYLTDHDMEINGYRDGVPIVRQRPGPNNSLGLVKFLFPNSYNIYLHDTPSKSLFNESSRAFSHGCIRVQEPEKLAAFLLRNKEIWNSAKIDRAMHSGKEQYITLDPAIPVFIAYFTAFIDRNGRLNFRKDIYDLDERLAETIVSGMGEYEGHL